MATIEKSSFIEKLNGSNFQNWKFKIQMILEEQELWNIVCGKEVLAQGAGDDDKAKFDKKDRKAMITICLSIDDKHIPIVRDSKTAKEAFESLTKQYEERGHAQKLYLRKKFF
jgi:hypothetical protein